ncbi:MAG: GDSL-type esterase/lipase family protein [Chitinophagales bacterium]
MRLITITLLLLPVLVFGQNNRCRICGESNDRFADLRQGCMYDYPKAEDGQCISTTTPICVSSFDLSGFNVSWPERNGVQFLLRGSVITASILMVGKNEADLNEAAGRVALEVKRNGQYVAINDEIAVSAATNEKQFFQARAARVEANHELRQWQKIHLLAGLQLSQSPSKRITRPGRQPQTGDLLNERLLMELEQQAADDFNKAITPQLAAVSCQRDTLPFFYCFISFTHQVATGETQFRIKPEHPRLRFRNAESQPFSVREVLIFNAQSPSSVIGDRAASASIQYAPGFDSSSVAVTLFYDTVSRAQRARGFRSPSCSATLTATGLRRIRASAILPHQQKFYNEQENDMVNNRLATFNTADREAMAIPPGATTFARWSLRYRQGRQEIFDSIPEVSFTMAPRFVFAIMGDSYGSGEGAPWKKSDPWLCDSCHRSVLSGLHRGVSAFIANHPEMDIDYVFTACSGAGIVNLTRSGRSISVCNGNISQIREVRQFLTRNNYNLNAIVLSAGGNDAGFATLIVNIIRDFANDISDDAATSTTIENGLSSLRGSYTTLADSFQRAFRVPANRVFVAEYPKPTRNADTLLCTEDCDHGPFFAFAGGEWGMADTFQQRINDTLRKITGEIGMIYMDGIDEQSLNHGLCNCDDNYFTTWGKADQTEGCDVGVRSGGGYDIVGHSKRCSFHPNARGYKKMYKDVVAGFLEQQLSSPISRRLPR